MALRVGRKEHDNEQGHTEVDDGSRNLRRTLRNGYGVPAERSEGRATHRERGDSRAERVPSSQRQSSAQGQSTHGDEGVCSEWTHGQCYRPGAAYGETPCSSRETPCAEARDRTPRSASTATRAGRDRGRDGWRGGERNANRQAAILSILSTF